MPWIIISLTNLLVLEEVVRTSFVALARLGLKPNRMVVVDQREVAIYHVTDLSGQFQEGEFCLVTVDMLVWSFLCDFGPVLVEFSCCGSCLDRSQSKQYSQCLHA